MQFTPLSLPKNKLTKNWDIKLWYFHRPLFQNYTWQHLNHSIYNQHNLQASKNGRWVRYRRFSSFLGWVVLGPQRLFRFGTTPLGCQPRRTATSLTRRLPNPQVFSLSLYYLVTPPPTYSTSKLGGGDEGWVGGFVTNSMGEYLGIWHHCKIYFITFLFLFVAALPRSPSIASKNTASSSLFSFFFLKRLFLICISNLHDQVVEAACCHYDINNSSQQ